jgi:hypothetical protein
MHMRVSLKRGLAGLAALGLVFAVAPVAANADTHGTNSLAAVLDVSNQAFDRNNADFDILTAAVVVATSPTDINSHNLQLAQVTKNIIVPDLG